MFAILFSFGGVINTEVFWMAYGTLLWAMLCPRPRPALAHNNTPALHVTDFGGRL
jgi:hypothetical protein